MKAVYVMSSGNIGVILDSGKDQFGAWYRTDSDGVRDSDELLFLDNKKEVKRCQKQLNANIAPSTRKLLGL